jgi:hypothetical protein
MKASALVHLALSRTERLAEPEADAKRLFLADALLSAGAAPAHILTALGVGASVPGALSKYSPDQPRVPAGNKRISGRWTREIEAAARSLAHVLAPIVPAPAHSTASAIAIAATKQPNWPSWLNLSDLPKLLKVLGIVGAGTAEAAGYTLLGALLNGVLVTPVGQRKEGVISGQPPVYYVWHSDDRFLTLSYTDTQGVCTPVPPIWASTEDSETTEVVSLAFCWLQESSSSIGLTCF